MAQSARWLPPRTVARPWRLPGLMLAPVAGTVLLWAAGAAAYRPGRWIAELGALAITSALAAAADRRRARGSAVVVGASAWVAAATTGVAVVLPWVRHPVDRLATLPGWLGHGAEFLLLSAAIVAAGGCVFGRLAAGRRVRPLPDPTHWLLGACLLAVAAVPLGFASAVAGPWPARCGAAVLAAVAGVFWPRWARAERSQATRWTLQRPPILPRRGGRARPAGAVQATQRQRPRRQWRWPPRWVAETARALWARPANGGVFPVTAQVVAARTNTARLLGLYGWAGLCAGPAALFLALGPRAADLWIRPAAFHHAALAAVLGVDFLALAACVALALRSGLLHPLELVMPRPRWLATVLFALLAAALCHLGAAKLASGPAGVLWHAHVWVLLFPLMCILLPAAQAAFFFGLLQTPLERIQPLWVALAIPAAAFAASGAVSGVPLPGLPLALALGLVLALARRTCGAGGAALALAAGNAAALALMVR